MHHSNNTQLYLVTYMRASYLHAYTPTQIKNTQILHIHTRHTPHTLTHIYICAHTNTHILITYTYITCVHTYTNTHHTHAYYGNIQRMLIHTQHIYTYVHIKIHTHTQSNNNCSLHNT